MAIPNLTVEVAFTTGPNDPAPSWTDVSDYVEGQSTVTFTRGRGDEFEQVQPSALTVLLDNRDGRFTPEYAGGAYYPDVKKGRRIRVRGTHNAVTYDRCSGYVDEWPVDWPDGTGYHSTVLVRASSRLARLGRAAELRSIIEEEFLLDTPAAYYTLGEVAGSTAAGNVSDTPQPPATPRGSGASPSFGVATGPGTDSLTAATFASGKFLQVDATDTFLSVSGSGESATYECFLLTTTNSVVIGGFSGGSEFQFTFLTTTSTGKLEAQRWEGGLLRYTVTSTTTVADGTTRHVALRETYGGTPRADLYVDGVSEDNSTFTLTFGFSQIADLYIGGQPQWFTGGTNYTGTLAHVALFASETVELSDARILQHATAGLTGFTGESSDARIERLANYAGVPTAEVTTEAGMSTTLAAQDTTGQTALSLMQAVVETEGGLLFDAKDGDLTFHGRSHRYSVASAMTLSASSQEIGSDINPKLDDQGLVNDITVTPASGTIVRAVDNDSIDDYGIYRDSANLLTTSDLEALDAANWAIGTGATPRVRITSITVDVVNLSTAQAATILTREIGDRVTLSGLPTQAPAASLQYFIEGYTETISSAAHQITFNLSPALTEYDVWILDSSTYSVLGTTTRLAY